MQLVGKNSRHVPVQAIAGATQLPRIDGDMISARGAALRTNHGHWYRLNYTCIGSHDHMKVVDFSYSLGERIPKSEWASDNLW